MKQAILLLLIPVLFTFTACDEDPYELELQTFDVRWYDDDNTGTQSIGDALVFSIQVNTTDPDSDDQFITEWDFTYYVNGAYGGILRGDEYIETNSLFFDAEVFIDKLTLPGPGALKPGDVVEFRLWARDNHNTQLEQTHRYVLED